MGALEYEGALRASLQAEYQIRLLSDYQTEPERSLGELADLVAHLPVGCALWREVGGVIALTGEEFLAREVIFRLDGLAYQNAGGEGRKPERMPLPRPAAEERAEHRLREKRQTEKARKHAERGRRRSQPTT